MDHHIRLRLDVADAAPALVLSKNGDAALLYLALLLATRCIGTDEFEILRAIFGIIHPVLLNDKLIRHYLKLC